jgi:ATP-dependent DNA helicase PIF1
VFRVLLLASYWLLGTGKSVLLKEIIRYCGGRSPLLAVTASTGMASVNIGGVTLHSFAGIGFGEKPPNVYLHMFKGNAFDKVFQRWRDVRTLIIDESVPHDFISPHSF